MRFRAQIVFALFVVACVCQAADVVDRILVTVNGKALVESELDESMRFEALQAVKPLSSIGKVDREAALERLIDREIIRQQVQSLFQPSQAAIEEEEGRLRALYPSAHSDDGWSRVLATYGFTREQFLSALSERLQVLNFVELRVRPTVKVSSNDVETYYREHLVPQVKAMGAEPDPLEAVAPKIERLLSEQKMNEVFSAWMANLRSQSNIRKLHPTLANAAATTNPGGK